MKLKRLPASLLLASVLMSFIACTDNCLEIKPQPQTLDLSGASQSPLVALGKVLFYDNHLSVNNSISCASCHKQALAFSDNKSLSHGFENRLTARNTLPIQNIRSFNITNTGPFFAIDPLDPFTNFFGNSKLFWDGREDLLSSMVLMPILNHVEMGMSDADAIVNKISTIPYYSNLFSNAFGSSSVDKEKIASALSTFVGTITSFSTRFDKYQMGQGTLTAQELQGMNLFISKYNCNSCHQTQMANAYETGGGFVNIGLESIYTDQGLGVVTHDPADNGKFKIPSLRNIALTAPYMHDGRFETLDQVLEHYNHGIQDHPNLDARLRNDDGRPKQMNISDQEKGAIIAFLNTLTDFQMITSPDYASPFKVQ